MHVSSQNIDALGMWEEVTSLVGIELCSWTLFQTVEHIDDVDQRETLSTLFHTRVEFVRLHPVASEPRGQRGRLTPHFLKHGVERGQGHPATVAPYISYNWIGGFYSTLAEMR